MLNVTQMLILIIILGTRHLRDFQNSEINAAQVNCYSVQYVHYQSVQTASNGDGAGYINNILCKLYLPCLCLL